MSTHRTQVKLSDVAAAAGVAPMTVSRVLNTPEQVAPDTAKRVRAAIERLGYVSNLLAGGLSSRRSRIIAAIVPTVASPIFAASLGAFTDELDGAGYHVVLGLSGYGTDNAEEALVGAILGRRPDGLLLTGTEHSAITRRRLALAAVPVVDICDLVDDPADMVVGFDHRAVGAAVAALFLAQGYRRFAAIGTDDSRAIARRRGFTEVLPPGSLLLNETLPAPASMQGGRAAVGKLQLSAEPVAMFCSSDLSAAGVMIEAGARGIAVPGQLAVCGFGDLEVGRATHPAVSTVSVDGAEIGRVAARCLPARLAGREAPLSVAVPFRVVQRGSTRPVTLSAIRPDVFFMVSPPASREQDAGSTRCDLGGEAARRSSDAGRFWAARQRWQARRCFAALALSRPAPSLLIHCQSPSSMLRATSR